MKRESIVRVLFDIGLLVGVVIILFAIPMDTVRPGAQLFLFKALCVTGGFLHAHITRHIAFPYINFKEETDPMKKALVIGLYAVFIWAYAYAG